MLTQDFPANYFVSTIVRLMDTIQRNDENYTQQERVCNLHYVYRQAANHFAQPHVRYTLRVKPKKLQAALETITGMVVYCWVKVSPDLISALAIYFTYALILDDSKPQKHPWWRLVNRNFPNVLNWYGPFCALNIYRSTVDFFEGCWIEHYHFHGYRGAEDFPDFSRRMNGLGHAVGASIWPAEMFDEQIHFLWVSDLISFYKEFYNERDQISLINNYSHVNGVSTIEALEKLVQNTLRESEQIMSVFKDKHPLILDTLTRFMHGYVTWHLCDHRYRVNEIYEQVDGDDEIGRKFCRYFERANNVGGIDSVEWAFPAVTDLSSSKGMPEPVQKERIDRDCLITPPVIQL